MVSELYLAILDDFCIFVTINSKISLEQDRKDVCEDVICTESFKTCLGR